MNRSLQEARPFERAVRDTVRFHGHTMVRSLHRNTIEVTTEPHLTRNGDCIIGVAADKGCEGLDERLKNAIRRDGATVRMRLVAGGETFELVGVGNSGLSLTHPHDIVIRKSGFISDRTAVVGASAAAIDIPRKLVEALRVPGAVGALEMEADMAW